MPAQGVQLAVGDAVDQVGRRRDFCKGKKALENVQKLGELDDLRVIFEKHNFLINSE